MIAGKIGAADVSDKQRIAGEHRTRDGWSGEVVYRNAHTLDRVAGSLHEIEPAITEREGVVIPDSSVRKRRAGALAKIDPRRCVPRARDGRIRSRRADASLRCARS